MEKAKIYELIPQAMREIGAIGKDSKNDQQGFMYRGIDAVYNALNPVMAKLGLFICPEILEQRREERTTKNGTALNYSVLTVKYTIYAPDGSNVSCVVIGEGMDSGDKASNKAMSVAMKYAMFQLFFIPTEAVDPDSEVHTDVLPKQAPAAKPFTPDKKSSAPALVQKIAAIPGGNPVFSFLKNEKAFMQTRFECTKDEMDKKFKEMRESLIQGGVVDDIPAEKLTMDQAKQLVEAMYVNFLSDKEEAK